MITDAELGRMGFNKKQRAHIRGRINGPRGGRAHYTKVIEITEKQERRQMLQVRRYRGWFGCGWSPERAAASAARAAGTNTEKTE